MARPAGVLAALLTAVVLASCGSTHDPSAQGASTSSPAGAPSSTTKTTSSPPDGPASAYPRGHLVAAPETPTTIPMETSKVPITQYIGAGQQIIIKASGFWPNTLYANYKVPITWTNLSGRPQKVVFDHIPVSSPTIPPGWKFVWKSPFGGSYTYSSASGLHALVILQAPTPIVIPGTTTTTSH